MRTLFTCSSNLVLKKEQGGYGAPRYTSIRWTLMSSTSMHFISSDARRFISLTTDIQLTLIKKTLNYLETTFFTLFKALGHCELPVC